MLCYAPIASDHKKFGTKRSNLTGGIEEAEIGLPGESMLGFQHSRKAVILDCVDTSRMLQYYVVMWGMWSTLKR